MEIKSSLETKDCLVLFFDIFGFSNIVEKAEDLEKISESLLELWGWIYRLKEKHGVVPFLFSDGGYILYPIDEGRDKGEIFKQAVQDVSSLQGKYLEKGYFLRGAMTCGSVTFSDSLLVGKPIIKAYYYESNLCPGPFIIFPAEEVEKLIDINVALVDIDLSVLPLKNQRGAMQCHIVFPPDKNLYIEEIAGLASRYTKYGRFEWGKLWYDTYVFLTETFDDFSGWRKRRDKDA
jgi:hypothetical protein